MLILPFNGLEKESWKIVRSSELEKFSTPSCESLGVFFLST